MNNEANISIYDADGAEEFPVLKAFQQYIDAEQAKARKRLLTVSIFFGVVLVTVIGIFSALVIKESDENKQLNNKLFEYATRDSDRKIEAARATAIQEATVKTMTDTLQKLQKQLEDQERKANEAAAAAAKELAAARASATTAATVDEAKQAENNAKLQKAIALLKAEKAKLEKEKEKFREQELERYRREHYPEYYAKKEAAERRQLVKELTLDDPEDEEEIEDVPVPPVRKEATQPSVKKNEDIDLDDNNAIEYFKDDTYTIPVEVKGKRAGWRVPLD